MIKKLQSILKKAVISPMLKTAIENTIEAIKSKDLNLACQLTAVKSFITGLISSKDKSHAFQEDQWKNEKILGDSVYSILDGLHHDLAFRNGSVPSGMMMFGVTKDGKKVCNEFKAQGMHPIIKRMKMEKNNIQKQISNKKKPPQVQCNVCCGKFDKKDTDSFVLNSLNGQQQKITVCLSCKNIYSREEIIETVLDI